MSDYIVVESTLVQPGDTVLVSGDFQEDEMHVLRDVLNEMSPDVTFVIFSGVKFVKVPSGNRVRVAQSE